MSLQTNLLNWFHRNARPLPWRKRYPPYEVWVSEIMLQQTQMETVLPYFGRWMKKFPTIRALAKSGEKKVLKAWEGLGYYSRARNLHDSAKAIVKKHNGVFPHEFDKILSLKGVGRYTAGAIASIAFNEPRPIVDGNVLRVLSRVYAIKKPIDMESNKELFWKLQKDLIPKGQARYFNQALMELGALVCTKDDPLCRACPIRNFCAALKQNKVENYPVRKKKIKITKVNASALVLESNGKYLLRKRPVGKIMGGLWEFPEWKLSKGLKLSQETIKNKTLQLAQKEFGMNFNHLEHVGVIQRNYTHFLEYLQVFKIFMQGHLTGGCGGAPHHARRRAARHAEDGMGLPQTGPVKWPSVWASKREFKKYPFSSAHAKIASLISQAK